jgi:hypothetical protein
MNKQCPVFTREYYLAMKRNKVMIQVTAWVNHRIIINVGKTQKTTSGIILFIKNSRKCKLVYRSTLSESRPVVASCEVTGGTTRRVKKRDRKGF